jgi:acyl-CoA thioesterase-1
MLKNYLLVISITLVITLGMPLSAVAKTSAGNHVILVFGDSLSAAYGIPVERGWVNLLQQRLADQGYPYTVANASVSGETTRGGLNRISTALAAHQPGIVILELGANDGLRGLPTEDMRRNLAAIIEQCSQSKARVLLIRMLIPPNFGASYTHQFEQSYDDTASKFQLPTPPFLLKGVAGDAQLTQEDGLHPKAEAQPKILDNVWGTLKPMLLR